jgi:hypothetical protein
MFPHPDSVIAFGLTRHQELQAETLQLRRVMAAVPCRPAPLRLLCRWRTWVGAVLVRKGTALQPEKRKPGGPHKAFPAGAS